MVTKYNADVDCKIIANNLHRLIGQVYKLLPYREEDINWQKPLFTIQNELAGLNALFPDQEEFNTKLLSLQCKLEGLLTENSIKDFDFFRGCIFDCIGKIKELKDICLDMII